MEKATFTIGVFGMACRIDGHGKPRIMVNVRTDQERQKELAGLPINSKVKIIDAPGGGIEVNDLIKTKNPNLFEVLQREVSEETACEIESCGDFRGPFMIITNNEHDTRPTGDLAFWMPIKIDGEPKPSNEALAHPWISLEDLESETEYRCVGKLGKNGRTGKMILAALYLYDDIMSRNNEISFEWEKINDTSGPIKYVLLTGNPDCNHIYETLSSFKNYGGQCCICKKCGRVETYPAPGEIHSFHGMSGEYIVEDDGSPGLGI